MASHMKLTLKLLTLAVPVVLIASASRARADAGPKITQVWACEGTRPGSLTARPLVLVFHSDGTFTYSSQTTVNGGANSLPFNGRGGGYGQWEKIGAKDFRILSRENMYINGNAGGFFYVDATVRLDKKAEHLCSGRPECTGTKFKIRLTQFTFDPQGNIVGEIDLLPASSEAAVSCTPLDDVFTGLP